MVKIKIENNAICGAIGIIFALLAVNKFKEDETNRLFKNRLMSSMKFYDDFSQKRA